MENIKQEASSEPVEEKKTRKSRKVENISFDGSLYYTEALIDGEIKTVFKPEFKDNILMRYRIQAARRFDTTIDQIKKGYDILNGKKLDGFNIDTLIERHGFFGVKASRDEVCRKNNKHLNQRSVDIAETKLMEILKSQDIQKSYISYVKEIRDELESNLKEKAIYGETDEA